MTDNNVKSNALTDIRVAKVLSDFEVVVNKGRRDGVVMGLRFLIHRYEEEIIDPITKEPLERLEHITGLARPKCIQEWITTLISDNPKWGILSSLGISMSNAGVANDPLDDPQVGDEVVVKNYSVTTKAGQEAALASSDETNSSETSAR